MIPTMFPPEGPQTPEALRRLVEDIVHDVNARQHEAPQRAALIRAAAYERKSRLITGEADYSLDIQADRAAEYIQAQNWLLAGIYADPSYSGKNGKRPDFKRLITDIKAQHIDVVVVHRLDRLYRNLESLLRFIRLLQRYGVRLVSITESIDTNTYWGLLIAQMLGGIAEMYVRYASEHTRAAKHQRVSRGLPNGSMYRYGYCNGRCSRCTDPNGPGYCPRVGQPDRGDGRVLVPHPIEMHGFQLIHELYHLGKSYADIAMYLNAHDFELPEEVIP